MSIQKEKQSSSLSGIQSKEELSNQLRELDSRSRTQDKKKPSALRFFCGLLMLGAGLYMIFQNMVITSTWGTSLFRIGGYNLPNGTILLPILIGISLLFLCEKKIWGLLFIALGVVIVITAIITSVSIVWRATSGWNFLIMFGIAFAGGAMMLRELFRS